MKTKKNQWEANELRNTKLLAIWTAAWLISMALATFGPELIWEDQPILTITTILINAALGAGMILMNRKYIMDLDELYKKITMDAMAITLGVGLVAGLSYSLLDTTNIIPFDAEIGHLIGLMGITYLISIIIGNLKYR